MKMQSEGIEPSPLARLVPKTSAYTSSATIACIDYSITSESLCIQKVQFLITKTISLLLINYAYMKGL